MSWFGKSAPRKVSVTLPCLSCSEPMRLDFEFRPGLQLVNGECDACRSVNAVMHTSAEKFYLDYLEAEAHVTYYQWCTRGPNSIGGVRG